jgi:hypothetical protein
LKQSPAIFNGLCRKQRKKTTQKQRNKFLILFSLFTMKFSKQLLSNTVAEWSEVIAA